MRFKKWLQLAILYGFDPDNENEVAIACAMLSKNKVTSPAAIIVLFLSHLARKIGNLCNSGELGRGAASRN